MNKPRFARLRRNLQQSGMQRIDAVLAEIAAQLRNPDLSLLDRAVLVGRRRELRASRWLMQRLIAPPNPSPAVAAVSATPPAPAVEPVAVWVVPALPTESLANPKTLQSILWDRVLPKLHSLQNRTDVPLEVDVLRQNKKQELLYLILRKLEDLFDELNFSQMPMEQLFEKKSLILQDLWRSTITDFYGKYYTITVNQSQLEVVETLLQETELVQTAILDRIPLAIELIAHLAFQQPLVANGSPFAAGSPEALARSEILLENLLIQVANSVVQPLLNRFTTVETIQQNFYDDRLMSIREIERFRNHLSWKYRLEQYVIEPKAIFESQYRLLIFSSRGIEQTAIYSPRHQELEQLAGVQLAVTLALETRDAIAPRLRAAVSFLGSGIIYVLTEVVGRSLGLIGRGILKGIGTIRQDERRERDSDKRER